MLVAIDTLTNAVVATTPIGQGAQAVVYVPDAVQEGDGTKGLEPLGLAKEATRLKLARVGGEALAGAGTPTSVTLFDQGLVQVLQAAVTGLEPREPYVLALVANADGSGAVEPLASFATNPAGSAIVNAIGPIRQIVQGEAGTPRRYLVVVPGTPGDHGRPVQLQVD
jgi:hypothetical protein